MHFLNKWFRRLRILLGRERVEGEMDEEFRFHLDKEIERNIQAGMNPDEARRQALLDFGGVERFKERAREARGVRPLEDLFTDLKLAFRGGRKNPVFTAVAVLSLALGIGANTAIFSIVNAMLIRESPFESPEELVNIYRETQWTRYGALSYPDFEELRRGTTEVFSELGGSWFTLSQRETGDGVERMAGELVTGDYFSLLGVGAHIGRTILPEDHVSPGAHPVVMLGYRYWQRAFAGDPGILGQSIQMSGRSYTVVGVAEEEFQSSMLGFSADFFAPVMMIDALQPLMQNSLDSRNASAFRPIGRLRPGVMPAQANVALRRTADRLKEELTGIWQPTDELYGLSRDEILFNPDVDRVVVGSNLLAMGLVAMVLLIACANLASFLLARAVDRRKETALRLALGASRERVVRQALTETMALAVAGGIMGLAVALWLQELAMGVTLPLPVPVGFDLTLDWRVLAFTLIVSLATGVVVGLLPALQSTAQAIAPTLKDESTGAGRPRAILLSRLLVTGQVAVSVILLVSAGLFIRSLDATRQLDPGFGEGPTAMVSFMVPAMEFSDEEGLAVMASVKEKIQSLPGVERVGAISNPHLNTLNTMILDVNAGGVQPPAGRSAYTVDFTSVDEGFFEVAGIDLLEGRTFDAGDRADGMPVAIVNEAMARRFWPGRSPLGQTIQVEVPGWPDVTVVGVVRTAKIHSLSEDPTPFLYLPYGQEFNAWVTVLAKTRGDATATAQSTFRLLREDYPKLVVTGTKTLEEHVGVMFILRRLSVTLSGVFAVVALALAVMGLYGVVSYAVARRAREMGIRLSLGAAPKSVIALQLKDGMQLVGAGAGLGILAASAVAQGLSGFLYGVSVFDAVTFGSVIAVLALVALVATYVPARRAGRVSPVEVLNRE
jgi:predicted permease